MLLLLVTDVFIWKRIIAYGMCHQRCNCCASLRQVFESYLFQNLTDKIRCWPQSKAQTIHLFVLWIFNRFLFSKHVRVKPTKILNKYSRRLNVTTMLHPAKSVCLPWFTVIICPVLGNSHRNILLLAHSYSLPPAICSQTMLWTNSHSVFGHSVIADL